MQGYLAERFALFNQWSTFSCPDSCRRLGCKEPNLRVPISLVDLAALSSASGQRATELFRRDVKIGFDPIRESEPWIGRLCLELKKPCRFLDGKECSLYRGRPVACALFPEYRFLTEPLERVSEKSIFRDFPCIQTPCSISPRRRRVLQELGEIFGKEVFLSEFYLFGFSPFVVDLKNTAGEGLEGIPVSEDGKTTFPHHRIEEIISQRLTQGGYLDDWGARIGKLDSADGLEDLIKIKRSTDQIATASGGFSLNIVHQFDGKRLYPFRLRK
ncbi:MAG TPA: hypothetical protein VMV04_24115 [Thermodesulfobacteriota bacterium]|nr:hypothetical protein [Thermodesulfobacteriota bacterium]